jgi:hypothetical protein
MIDMLFQNIIKRKKKFLGPLFGGAGVGTISPNRGCSVGASIRACLGAQVEMFLHCSVS